MKKVFAFDFDGTIADTRDVFYAAFRQTCLSMGIEALTPETFLNVFDGNMFSGLLALGLEEGREPAFMEHLKILLADSQASVVLFPGMAKVLSELGEKYPVYIVTSNASSIAESVLKNHSITSIQAVLGGDVEMSKVVKLGGLKNQYLDHRLYYIGDTCGDIVEAHHAGVQAFAVSWGWHSFSRMQVTKPDGVLKTPADLFDL